MTRLNRGHAIAAALAITMAAGGTALAQGHFELDGTGQTFDEVSAFRIRARHNPREHETMVLLTTSAPDREAIRDADDTYAVAINDPAAAEDFLTLVVRGDGTVSLNADIGGVQYVDSSGTILGARGSLAADCSVNSAEHVACVVRTREPVHAHGGGTWEMEATFDLDVMARAAGDPLPAGGGAPGAALASLQKALEGDDLEAILATMTEVQASDYRADWRSPEENLAALREDLARVLPVTGQVLGGEVRGDEAKLEVQGQMEGWGEDEVLFQVTMVRTGDRWAYDSSRFVGLAD